MNKNVVLAVARRDLKSWFGNPTGYLFIILFVGLSVLALLVPPEFFRNNLANLDTLNELFPFLAVLFCAAITMGTWSTERSSGTQELLFTLPARDSELLLGKYLAALGVYTVSLLFLLTLPVGLSFLGTPDWGQLFCNFLGYWLLGMTLIATSMIGSQASEHLALSLIFGALVSAAVVYSGWVVRVFGFGSSWLVNGVQGQFGEFARGVVGSGGLLLFVGLTVTFLYLNLALLSRRHHRPGELQGAHDGVRFVALAVAAGALTAIGVHALPRIDGTIERIHSLGAETRSLLAGLDPNKPVIVTAWVSSEVPRELVQQKRNLLNLIDEFDRLGGDAVQQRVVMTEPFSPEAVDAEKNHDIQSRTLRGDEGATSSTSIVYLGFAVQSGPENVTVPFVEPGQPLEYELARSIRVVSKQARKKVGVLKTDVELYGGFDFQTFQQKPRWAIVEELQLQYAIENVDAEQDYPAGLEALVVPQPSSLGQEQMDRLQKWILAGNSALLIEDPAPLDAPGTSATDQKGGRRNPMMGGPPEGGEKGNFAAFLGSFGAAMPVDQVVWDLSYRKFSGGAIEQPEFLFLTQNAFRATDAVTSGLERAVVLFGGHVQQQAKEGWQFEPLLTSPRPDPRNEELNGFIAKQSLFAFNPFGGPQQIDPRRRHLPAPNDYVLAARYSGRAPEGGKAPKVVLLADLDMVGNQFFAIRRAFSDANMRFDNVTFVLNCIDSLVGDESLIELRKRRPKLRSLTTVEKQQSDFEALWIKEKNEAENAASDELKQAQSRLDEAVARIKDNQGLDEAAKDIRIQEVQNNENRKFELAKARIDEQKVERIELARHDRDAAKQRLYNSYRWLMLLLTPVPALAMGLMTFARKRAREAATVPENRKAK